MNKVWLGAADLDHMMAQVEVKEAGETVVLYHNAVRWLAPDLSQSQPKAVTWTTIQRAS